MKKINFADARITALIEALKELGRVYLIAVLPILVDSLVAGNVSWRIINTTGVIAVIRAIDKYLHEYGKETRNDTLLKGLTQF